MEDGFYHILILIVAAFSVITGFRKGFTGQVSGILGLAFGIVCCRVFEEPSEEFFRALLPGIGESPFSSFIYSVISATTVYVAVFLIFRFFTAILRSALQIFYVGMLNRLAGSVFCLLKNLVFLSLFYNLILCINPDSNLERYSRADDGNMVEGVTMLAPSLLGCMGVEDLSHIRQLRDAKKISHNIRGVENVIIYKESNHLRNIEKQDA